MIHVIYFQSLNAAIVRAPGFRPKVHRYRHRGEFLRRFRGLSEAVINNLTLEVRP